MAIQHRDANARPQLARRPNHRAREDVCGLAHLCVAIVKRASGLALLRGQREEARACECENGQGCDHLEKRGAWQRTSTITAHAVIPPQLDCYAGR